MWEEYCERVCVCVRVPSWAWKLFFNKHKALDTKGQHTETSARALALVLLLPLSPFLRPYFLCWSGKQRVERKINKPTLICARYIIFFSFSWFFSSFFLLAFPLPCYHVFFSSFHSLSYLFLLFLFDVLFTPAPYSGPRTTSSLSVSLVWSATLYLKANCL